MEQGWEPSENEQKIKIEKDAMELGWEPSENDYDITKRFTQSGKYSVREKIERIRGG